MKTKSFIFILSCLLSSSLFYLLLANFPTKSYSDENSFSLNIIIKNQHNDLPSGESLKSNFQSLDEGTPLLINQQLESQFNSPKDDVERMSFISSTESTYLTDEASMYIDFNCKPKYFDVKSNRSLQELPVFVTAIKAGDENFATKFIRKFHSTFKNGRLIIYSLNILYNELEKVNQTCGNYVNCTLRQFNFDKYPTHVRDLQLNAFRPIIIHEVLDFSGSIIWLNIDYLPNSYEKAINASNSAKNLGFYSWKIEKPTSSMTHPKMFEILKCKRDSYYFHRMIDPSSLIILNNPNIHNDLIVPWVKCSLVYECISPIGAQSTGCKFDKKPIYRYSGCHSYDMSALNVLLGSLFNYKEKSYTGSDEDKFFTRI